MRLNFEKKEKIYSKRRSIIRGATHESRGYLAQILQRYTILQSDIGKYFSVNSIIFSENIIMYFYTWLYFLQNYTNGKLLSSLKKLSWLTLRIPLGL